MSFDDDVHECDGIDLKWLRGDIDSSSEEEDRNDKEGWVTFKYRYSFNFYAVISLGRKGVEESVFGKENTSRVLPWEK